MSSNVDEEEGLALLEDGSLEIMNAQVEDSTTYSCRAYNTMGSATRTYMLLVQGTIIYRIIYYLIRNVFAIDAFNKPCNPSNLIQTRTLSDNLGIFCLWARILNSMIFNFAF